MLLGMMLAGSALAQTPAGVNPALLNPGDSLWQGRAPEVFRVRFETTRGAFVMEVHRPWAPRGADRVFNLVRSGFYNDSRFSRVVSGWIVQFGIPGDPRVGAVWRNQSFPDDSVVESNRRSFVAFAMTGPNQRTTQLFISRRDNVNQDPQGFAPVGRVVAGMEVVDSIYSGYGETSGGGMRAGRQGPVFEGGNAYLDQNYPKLDKLIKASIESDTGKAGSQE